VPSLVEIGQTVLEMKRWMTKTSTEAGLIPPLHYSGGEHNKNKVNK
jgi:hypothetical protein